MNQYVKRAIMKALYQVYVKNPSLCKVTPLV